MVNYKNGRIYKLVNDVDDEIYVGSTTQPLNKRKQSHKCISKRRQSNVYNHLNKIGWEHVKIVLIERYPCEDKEHLLMREEYHRKLLGAGLNKYKAYTGLNKKQYSKQNYIDNKDKIKQQKKQYRIVNKQYINEKIKCECGCMISRRNIRQHQRTNKHKKLMEK